MRYMSHYKLYIKYKKRHDEKTYKVFRSNLNKILRISERDHYDNLLTEKKSYLKKMWSVINKIINKRKHKPMTSKFVVGDREIYDSRDIAEHFNNLFTNVAKNVANLFNEFATCTRSSSKRIKNCQGDTNI